jgi:hypothetical protein
MDAKVATPVDLPFDHDDVRVYIDNLFLEGLLQPIAVSDLGVTAQGPERSFGWVAVGLRIDPVKDHDRRLERLLQTVEASLPHTEARGQDWLAFARRWAELTFLRYSASGSGRSLLLPQFRAVQEKVDTTFTAWVQQHYASLYNQPVLPPLMLHHVPRVLARYLQQSEIEKVALLLLDGLALDQWLVLREVLTQQEPQVSFHDEAVFAWLPTTTSVSRQAVFAGKPPLYYPTSIHTTDKEAGLWTQFWADQGLPPTEVGYEKGLGEEFTLSRAQEAVSHPKLRAVGLIVDTVDKIMHGMQLYERYTKIWSYAVAGPARWRAQPALRSCGLAISG